MMSASKLRLYWRLQLAAHYLQKNADRELLAKAYITTAQTGVMAAITNGKNITQKNIADRLGLNESAVTAMVRRLVALGYIERRQSQNDGRAKLLTLTPLGKDVQANVRPPFRKINNRIENTLSEEEIENLAEYLERLTESFK
ncbi:MAG: MarR family transcriptional regulator [Sphingorhabdus sp.]